jgi:hypothetical protein
MASPELLAIDDAAEADVDRNASSPAGDPDAGVVHPDVEEADPEVQETAA